MRFSTNKTMVLALALAMFAVGCGDDDGGGSGGSSGSSGSGGSGGSSGTSGSGGSGGTAGTDMTCGTVTCPEFPEVMVPDAGAGGLLGGGGLPIDLTPGHCCTDTNACGVSNSTLLNANACIERDQIGQPSTECPTEMIGSFISVTLPGCCRPDGACGLSGAPMLGGMMLDLGTGCTERAELAAAMAGSLAGSFLGGDPTWTSASCTYVPEMDGGTGDDAGN